MVGLGDRHASLVILVVGGLGERALTGLRGLRGRPVASDSTPPANRSHQIPSRMLRPGSHPAMPFSQSTHRSGVQSMRDAPVLVLVLPAEARRRPRRRRNCTAAVGCAPVDAELPRIPRKIERSRSEATNQRPPFAVALLAVRSDGTARKSEANTPQDACPPHRAGWLSLNASRLFDESKDSYSSPTFHQDTPRCSTWFAFLAQQSPPCTVTSTILCFSVARLPWTFQRSCGTTSHNCPSYTDQTDISN